MSFSSSTLEHNAPALRKLAQHDPAAVLAFLAEKFDGRIAFSTSFGLEDQVITHLIFSQNLPVKVFTLDTGRQFQETYSTWARTLERYRRPIEVFSPQPQALQRLLGAKGPNSFYDRSTTAGNAARSARWSPCAVPWPDNDSGSPASAPTSRPTAATWPRSSGTRPTNSTNSTPCSTGLSPRCALSSSATTSPTTPCTTAASSASAAHPAPAPSAKARISEPGAGGGRRQGRRSAGYTLLQ